ncbi:MAG TPA: threonine/serine dehydratase, partial [Pyrinomonadaceae bacterium]|nr:threonine/serine dehydratase [Pyrinomonadaceae bacterium]
MNHITELSRERIQATERVIRPYIRRTPILEVEGSEFGLEPVRIVFKLELFQHAGSFKARGAFTNMLTREVPAAGVVAASGGNHGAAVAFVAMKLSKPATIFVPSVASQAKLDRIRNYGAELIIAGDRYAESLEASEVWTKQSGALPIHAYEGDETLLGQGTLGLELEQQDPKLDSLLVAVGGGGLIGGVAAWYQNRVKVVAVEPTEAPTLHLALKAGRPVDSPAGGIAADSLAPRQVGKQMFPIAQQFVQSSLLVTDEEILDAQKRLWEATRIIAEPGG